MTLKNPNLPDAGWDPIASEEVPFSGDFWMAGDYAVHSNYINPATGTSVTVRSDKFNVSGDAKFAKTMIVDGYEYIHGADDDDYGLKVDNKIYAGGMDITGDLIIDGNCYITQEITASTGKFEEVSAQSATADVLYVTQLLSAVSATFHNIDITASEASGFVITGERPVPSDYYEIPDPLPISAHSNLWLDKAGLMVDGWAILSGDVKMERKLGVSGDVTLSGNTSVNTLNATGAVDFDSTLNVDGATTFGNTLNVTGKTTLSDELYVVKSITTERNLYVTGNAKVGAFGSFGTYVSAAGSDNNGYGLIIEKNANIKGNTDIGGTLGVTGAVDFDSTLNVDGATTLNSLDVTNNATVGGTLGVAGATTLSSTLGVTGATTLNSTLNVSGDTTTTKLAVSGMLGVTGQVSMANNLRVDGYTTMNNKLLIASGGCDIVGPVSAVNLVSTNVGFYVVKNQDFVCKIQPDGSRFSILTDDATLLEYYGVDIVAKAPNIQQTLRFTYKPSDAKWAMFLGRDGGSSTGHTLYIPNLDGTLARIEDINSSLTSYATKQYVDDKIGDINTILDEINGEAI